MCSRHMQGFGSLYEGWRASWGGQRNEVPWRVLALHRYVALMTDPFRKRDYERCSKLKWHIGRTTAQVNVVVTTPDLTMVKTSPNVALRGSL